MWVVSWVCSPSVQFNLSLKIFLAGILKQFSIILSHLSKILYYNSISSSIPHNFIKHTINIFLWLLDFIDQLVTPWLFGWYCLPFCFWLLRLCSWESFALGLGFPTTIKPSSSSFLISSLLNWRTYSSDSELLFSYACLSSLLSSYLGLYCCLWPSPSFLSLLFPLGLPFPL